MIITSKNNNFKEIIKPKDNQIFISLLGILYLIVKFINIYYITN